MARLACAAALLVAAAAAAPSPPLNAATGKPLSPLEAPATAFYVNGRRPPGTLLLNMLIKNEEAHLRRTLPAWAKIIDAWVIGIDDNNTDASPDVVRELLGHIPGSLVTVHFDGMGPTWSVLVQEGVDKFPNITHGIIADADFRPMVDTMDKMELDIRISKGLFTIWTEDHSQKRKLDWIYRNVPGAKVIRRTHQSVIAPPLPAQELFIAEIHSLVVDERPGGYQDRAGGAVAKAKRYIGFLEADLAEFGANDTRSLYYLGTGWYDYFHAVQKENGASEALRAEAWEGLHTSLHYFHRRAAIPAFEQGPREERWFALIKAGEIYERYLRDPARALQRYLFAIHLDPERADAWFYAGQVLRLFGYNVESVPLMHAAIDLQQPDRALFQWRAMYTCIPRLELARSLLSVPISPDLLPRPDDSAAVAAAAAADARPRFYIGSELISMGLTLESLEQPYDFNATRAKLRDLMTPLRPNDFRVAAKWARRAVAGCTDEQMISAAQESKTAAVALDDRRKELQALIDRSASSKPRAPQGQPQRAAAADAAAAARPTPTPTPYPRDMLQEPLEPAVMAAVRHANSRPDGSTVATAAAATTDAALDAFVMQRVAAAAELLRGVAAAAQAVDLQQLERHDAAHGGGYAARGVVPVSHGLQALRRALQQRLHVADTVPLLCRDVRLLLRQWRGCGPATAAQLPATVGASSQLTALCAAIDAALRSCSP